MSRQSARFTKNSGYSIKIDGCSRWGFVKLPKIGWLRFTLNSNWKKVDWESHSSVTVIQEASGTYHVSIVVEKENLPDLHKPDRVAGIDLGLTDLATIAYSDGTREKIANPKHLRHRQKQLRSAGKSLSRKVKGSANWNKARRQLAIEHEKVAIARKDLLDKLSRRLVDENQVLCLETLSSINMSKNRRLAKSIMDSGWRQLCTMIEYKQAESGGEVAFIDAFFPSTRTCSVCKAVSEPKPLNIRSWTCTCGAELDRDYNAAVNIMDAAGHAESLNACGGDVRRELSAISAVSGETGTH